MSIHPRLGRLYGTTRFGDRNEPQFIADGQQAIVEGDYARAEEINKILADILADGAFDHPLAKDYLDIVLAAEDAGYEVVNLNIQGDRAEVRVTAAPPTLADMIFQRIDCIWQIQP